MYCHSLKIPAKYHDNRLDSFNTASFFLSYAICPDFAYAFLYDFSSAGISSGITQTVLSNVSLKHKRNGYRNNSRSSEKNLDLFLVITVSADSVAPFPAEPAHTGLVRNWAVIIGWTRAIAIILSRIVLQFPKYMRTYKDLRQQSSFRAQY